jgi:hypothetical protein
MTDRRYANGQEVADQEDGEAAMMRRAQFNREWRGE